MWDGLAARLEGEIVVLEPLAAAREEGLWAAARILRRHMVTTNVGVRDSAYYGITDEEWSEVRANLARRLAAARAQPAAGR